MQTPLSFSQEELVEYIRIISEYHDEGKYGESVYVCDKVISLYPGVAEFHFLRGVSKYLMGDHEGAISDLDTAIDLEPGYTDAYYYRSRAKSKSGQYIGAMKDMNRARSHNFFRTFTIVAGDLMESVFGGDNNEEEKGEEGEDPRTSEEGSG